MKFETKAIHFSQEPDKETGAVILPIHLSTTFYQEGPGNHKGFEYSRTLNPTRKVLEEVAASLEEGKFGLAFSSGTAANMAILSILLPGDEIISSSDIYGGTFRIFEKILRPLGINTKYVFTEKPEDFENQITEKTKMIWIETPSNPLLKIYDIEKISKVKQSKDIVFVVDNTFATPYFQKPLNLGADVVVYSSTKYLNGHSDVVGGLVILNDQEIRKKIRFYQNAAGGVPSPFDCFLVLRGLKTLAIRMEKHFENVKKVRDFLIKHKLVKKVYFPDIENDPVYKKQMTGFPGMISFEVDLDEKQIDTFMKSLKIITCAESLGGIESLICLPAKMTHATLGKEEREKRGIKDNLIRLSVGIENIEDIIQDLNEAFDKASK